MTLSGIISFSKEKTINFIWQHTLLLISLYIMTLGVALCVRSCLGSSVISSLPMAFSIAGEEGLAPGLTIGGYTNIMNILLVALQIVILRRRFRAVQLFQLIIGFLFGAMIDLNMYLTSMFSYEQLWQQTLAQFAGCTVMAFGIAMEVRCGSVTMPGEGIQVALCEVTGMTFPKMKIIVDTALVVLAVAACYIFWGRWVWAIIGPGTLFAMLYIGWMVRVMGRHLGWFERLLAYSPGFRRYLFGLARLLFSKKSN